MNETGQQDIKNYHRTAAIVSTAIGGVLVMYAAVVEILRNAAHYAPPLAGSETADVIRPVLYALAFASVAAARIVPSRLLAAAKVSGPAELAGVLTRICVVRTALYEVPGVLGLVGWLIAGFYPDFYAFLALSLILVIRGFPRLSEWEREFAGRFGAVTSGAPEVR